MPDDLPFVRWTIRAAIACYAGRVLADVSGVGSYRLRRLLWTLGLACYLLHFFAAFHVVHRWSHAAALVDTQQATEAITGWKSGAGLWVNYAFSLFWLGDLVAWWSVGPGYPRQHRRMFWAVHGLFAFIVFNATAVFGPAFWRPVVCAFALLIGFACLARIRPGLRPER